MPPATIVKCKRGGTKIYGAIFDADGTLLASMHIWRECGAYYLRSIGLTPEYGLSAKLWPLSFEQGCMYIRDKYNLSCSVQEIREGIFAMIANFYRNEAVLKPGVREVLERMKRKNIPMVIATSGNRELLEAALRRNGIAEYFSRVFTCGELHTDKRHPEIFVECAKFLGLAPEHIAVFEDSLFALETAKRAGFIEIGVEDRYSIHDKDRILLAADYYVEDWRHVDFEQMCDCRRSRNSQL